MVEWSGRNGCYAISPLVVWNEDQVQAYMKQYDLPFHPLYESGYKSIGLQSTLSCTFARPGACRAKTPGPVRLMVGHGQK